MKELTEKQKKLLERWKEDDTFWNYLSVNQRDIIIRVHKYGEYFPKDVQVLNSIREEWIKKVDPDLMMSPKGFVFYTDRPNENNDYVAYTDVGYLNGDFSDVRVYSKKDKKLFDIGWDN